MVHILTQINFGDFRSHLHLKIPVYTICSYSCRHQYCSYFLFVHTPFPNLTKLSIVFTISFSHIHSHNTWVSCTPKTSSPIISIYFNNSPLSVTSFIPFTFSDPAFIYALLPVLLPFFNLVMALFSREITVLLESAKQAQESESVTTVSCPDSFRCMSEPLIR